MKEKWLVSFGITHTVFLSFVLTFAVKNALLFYLPRRINLTDHPTLLVMVILPLTASIFTLFPVPIIFDAALVFIMYITKSSLVGVKINIDAHPSVRLKFKDFPVDTIVAENGLLFYLLTIYYESL